jgi:CDP-diacylglycerol--glycerol-3-phosphate 3-phosphatidyltransferase
MQINSVYTRLYAILLIIIVLCLDIVDGYVARKWKVFSDFGSLFDIAADRIIENGFWIYFSTTGLVNFWIPMIVIVRSFMVDLVRTLEFRNGNIPFNGKSNPQSAFNRMFVTSVFSRSFYNGSKVFAFASLGLIILAKTQGFPVHFINLIDLQIITKIFVLLAVSICIIRGLVVVLEKTLLLRNHEE